MRTQRQQTPKAGSRRKRSKKTTPARSQSSTAKSLEPTQQWKVIRPCTLADGVSSIFQGDLPGLISSHDSAAQESRILHLILAGAPAAELFKPLVDLLDEPSPLSREEVVAAARAGSFPHQLLLEFIDNLEQFAFFDDLQSILSAGKKDLYELCRKGPFRPILEALLAPKGLAYAQAPMGLVRMHRYPEGPRSAFEEHFLDAAGYSCTNSGRCRVHFSTPPQHAAALQSHFQMIKDRWQREHPQLDLTFSQPEEAQPHTGNGAAEYSQLQEFFELYGDIVFVRRLGNIAHSQYQEVANLYRKALSGYLIDIQAMIFNFLERLQDSSISEQLLRYIVEFSENRLSTRLPEHIIRANQPARIQYLIKLLDRPLRVCGVIRDNHRPGARPFWVEAEGRTSLQILEADEVPGGASGEFWQASHYLHAEEIVCALRDRHGRPYDVRKFGRAASLSLWGAGMSGWNTILIEVPRGTYNPVHSLFTLLRREHQPIFAGSSESGSEH